MKTQQNIIDTDKGKGKLIDKSTPAAAKVVKRGSDKVKVNHTGF